MKVQSLCGCYIEDLLLQCWKTIISAFTQFMLSISSFLHWTISIWVFSGNLLILCNVWYGVCTATEICECLWSALAWQQPSQTPPWPCCVVLCIRFLAGNSVTNPEHITKSTCLSMNLVPEKRRSLPQWKILPGIIFDRKEVGGDRVGINIVNQRINLIVKLRASGGKYGPLKQLWSQTPLWYTIRQRVAHDEHWWLGVKLKIWFLILPSPCAFGNWKQMQGAFGDF